MLDESNAAPAYTAAFAEERSNANMTHAKSGMSNYSRS